MADAYALNCAVCSSEELAGQNIGFYGEPLESVIYKTQLQFPSGSPIRQLAEKLKVKIASITDPAFFAHW
ncbi:MAG: hypothetical protein ACHQUC_08910 [Chlamydiales bacterium]